MISCKSFNKKENHDIMIFLLSLSCFFLAIRFHLFIQSENAFFDDVFIYLHVAHNAIFNGDMRYFPISGRPALLASSPLKLIIFSLSTYLLKARGLSELNLQNARNTIEIGVYLQFFVFLPIWRKNLAKYLFISIPYFYYASGLLGISQFESGLIYFWVCTVFYIYSQNKGQNFLFCLLLAAGALIRPEICVLIVAIFIARMHIEKLDILGFLKSLIFASLVIGVAWSCVAYHYDVWPIPVTWWAKAAIPKLFDEHYMLHYLLERTSVTFAPYTWSLYFKILSVAYFFVLACLIYFVDRKLVFVIALSMVFIVLLTSRMAANFWWYYHNIGMLVVAVLAMMAVSSNIGIFRRSIFSALLFLTAALYWPAYGVDASLPWNFAKDSRAQGYIYVAGHAKKDGVYSFVETGDIYIRMREIGMVGYFSGINGWIWDSAGLAQPEVELGMDKSRLRFFYPKILRKGADADILRLANGPVLPIYDVWAMEDRNFYEARKKCNIVIEAGFLCLNRYR